METRDYIRPVLTGLIGIGAVVLVIVLLVKAVTGGGGNLSPSSSVDITKYANTSAAVSVLSDAPTGIDQDHRQVRITVTSSSTEIDVLKGYQGDVMSTHTYSNNSTAFGVFLQTLQLLNFSRGRSGNLNYQGYCPTGNRYVYSFNGGDGTQFKYWSTSCGQGTFQGKASQVLQQFRRQIPDQDFGKLTNGIQTGF